MQERTADRNLVTRLRSGDAAAVGDLEKAYRSKIYQLALRYMKNPEDAEEVTQDVLLRVHQKVEAFRGDSALSLLDLSDHVQRGHVQAAEHEVQPSFRGLAGRPDEYDRLQGRCTGPVTGSSRLVFSGRRRTPPSRTTPEARLGSQGAPSHLPGAGVASRRPGPLHRRGECCVETQPSDTRIASTPRSTFSS